MFEYAETARERGLKVIIAGAGGAHIYQEWLREDESSCNRSSSSIKSVKRLRFIIIHRPNARRVPVATVAIGKAGSTNAGLLAHKYLDHSMMTYMMH